MRTIAVHRTSDPYLPAAEPVDPNTASSQRRSDRRHHNGNPERLDAISTHINDSKWFMWFRRGIRASDQLSVAERRGAGIVPVLDEAVLGDRRRLAAMDRARRATPALPMPLDAIAGLAARLLGAPMAVITFVGHRSEHFAGVHHLPSDLAAGGQAPLAYSVCKYMISEDAPVCSPDMAVDDDVKLREHLLHTEYGVRAFIGVPLRDGDDQPVGSLTVLDTAVHQWSDANLSTLVEIAHLLDPLPGTCEQFGSAAVAALDPAALVDSVQEGFIAVDPRGVVVGFNRAAQELLGWTEQQVCGRHLDDTVLPGYDGRPIDEALGRLFTAPTARRVPRRVSVRHRDGHRIPASMELSVVHGAAGALACAFFTDLSQQAAAESDAERQRRFLAALLDNLDVGVAAIDTGNNPLVVNRALRRVHGIADDWNATEVQQAFLGAVCDLDGTPLPLERMPLLRALDGEHVRDVDVLLKSADHRERIFVAHAQPIMTADGRRLGAVTALHDVTVLRRAERFRACEQQIQQILTAAATVGDAAAAVLRAVAGALGWPHAELWLIDPLTDTLQQAGHWSARAGQCDDLHPRPVDKGAGILGTVWATGQPLGVPDIADTAQLAGDPSVAQAQACARLGLHAALAVPIRDGNTLLGVLTCYAGTREDDQDLLTVLLSGVAAKFGMFVTQRRAADLAEQLARTRNDFLTLVGHELRTPLASILSYAGLLAEDTDTPANEARQMIQAIERNAHLLRGVVDDLLELAGLQAGHLPLTITELDLTGIVATAAAAAAPAAADTRVRLHTKLPKRLLVHGDATRLRQAVDNLLSNAITYSPHGGDIHIRLTADDTTAELRITDTGIGIPSGEHHRLADRFYRASNVAHHGFPGAGLGLTLVHAIAALHHGSITFDTEHQPGTSVLLRLARNVETGRH
jgi:PAS domain S-box-containing protein